MRRLWIVLILFCGFLTLPGEAAPSHPHQKRHPVVGKRTVVKKKPKIQQHYSFIPPAKPSALIARLQAPLTGQVVQHQTLPIALPVFIPTSPLREITPTSMALLDQKPTYHPWPWFNLKAIRTPRRHVSPEVVTSNHSWVTLLNISDAAQLSSIIARIIQDLVPNQHTALKLEEPPTSQTGNALTLNLQYTLKSWGYVLTTENQPTAAKIRYRISHLNQALLVRIRVNGVETARLYQRADSGALVAASPISRLN